MLLKFSYPIEMIELNPKLREIVSSINTENISKERQESLQMLIDHLTNKINTGLPINLNFICTHNSRRSQFAQIWAKVAATYSGVEINSFSGGVETTSFNERAVESLKRFGFEIRTEGENNPKYFVKYSKNLKPIVAFSKLFDDETSPKENFSAIMTCSHADDNCPFIPGAEKRIPIRYEDPKEFDGTPEEEEMYDARSIEIATEMLFVFSVINK